MVTSVLTQRQFTIDEYHRMGESGILHEDDRVELIEGKIVSMSPIGLRHTACVKRLIKLFSSLVQNNQTLISVQDPLIVNNHNEPEPDIVLLKYLEDCYESKRPSDEDALLVIEVADTSLTYDKTIKVPLYAKSQISDLWIVDLNSNTTQTFRFSNGKTYQEVKTHKNQDAITPLAFPDFSISVSNIFGTKTKYS